MNLGLPEHFEFYGLGEVVLQSSSAPDTGVDTTGLRWVGFSAYSESGKAWIACGFPDGLDESLYTELANIIASRWASGRDMMLGAPQKISRVAIDALTRQSIGSSYLHLTRDGFSIPVHVRTPRYVQSPLDTH